MRRITILFFVLLILILYYPIRYWLARPPDPGTLIVPTSLRKSFFEMEKIGDAERYERYTFRDWEEPR